jgi:S-formylglutathione hydrolase FrmB
MRTFIVAATAGLADVSSYHAGLFRGGNMRRSTRTACVGFRPFLLAMALLFSAPLFAQDGRVEEIVVPGSSLEGNLNGDPSDRSVFVYLPPSYDRSPQRRYPVVYLLHGYGLQAARWMTLFDIEGAAHRAMTGTGEGEQAREMIVVNPSAYTIYDGSFYTSSLANGDWERFIAEDLVADIDSRYRTLPDRMSRGLAGHSMGGYGALRIGMKRPDVFSALYPLAACCMFEDGGPSEALEIANGYETREEVIALGYPNKRIFARAAAWSPNPQNPPFYVDLPVVDGEERPEIQAKWLANSILPMLGQYTLNLKRYTAIQFDVGLDDGLLAGNERLHTAMEEAGIPHVFETYEGDHNNRISLRIETRVLPFFAEHLAFDFDENRDRR